jgi:hypothetical protein
LPLRYENTTAKVQEISCYLLRLYPLSSKNHETATGTGTEEGKSDTSGVANTTVGVGRYWALPNSLAITTRRAKSAKVFRFMMLVRLSAEDILLD